MRMLDVKKRIGWEGQIFGADSEVGRFMMLTETIR